ncbi:MAG: endonuclease/exonuclease/phosphatase family protein [bacterium]
MKQYKFLSWNIQGGKKLTEITQLILNENPDFIALQEVRHYADQVDGATLLKNELAKLRKIYFVEYFQTFVSDRHQPSYGIGNALLSRLPFKSIAKKWLSNLDEYLSNEKSALYEPRGAILADVEIAGNKIVLVSTHLAYVEGFADHSFKQEQTNQLLKAMGDNEYLLGIDLNSLPDSSIFKTIQVKTTFIEHLLNQSTWTNQNPNGKYGKIGDQKRIDYIFTNLKDSSNTKFAILNASGSDHLPLLLTFNL